jgi:hypothetical protein
VDGDRPADGRSALAGLPGHPDARIEALEAAGVIALP